MTNIKNASIHVCEICNFKCSKQSNYVIHLNTAKHIRLTNTNAKMPNVPNVYICDCGKEYKHMSSLCKHKKHVPILPTKYLMIKSIRYQIQ